MDLQSIKNRFGIIGNSPALNYALEVAVQVANTDLTVLISGESGVGKEAFSQIIHTLSARKHNPFIAVNCGAIPEGTIDSELFGHEKGSFTGALDGRKGYFETVNGGTIFLDEIGEMPLGTQARLLRVLESGEFIRVGSSKVQKTDVRVVAASNKDLLMLVQQNRFREDLYYRLNTVPIRVPALRDRKEDIHLIFRKFVVDFSERYKTLPVQLDDEAREKLVSYTWPGNIRELKNIAEQISVLASEKLVTSNELNRFLPESHANRLPVLAGHAHQGGEFNNEREILYKLFFDMKRDVTELKKLFLEVMKNPALAAQSAAFVNQGGELQSHEDMGSQSVMVPHHNIAPAQPVMMHDGIHDHEEVEDSLNLIEAEKQVVLKALRKHKNRRKDAAVDLGISERTLYRKLKDFGIEI